MNEDRKSAAAAGADGSALLHLIPSVAAAEDGGGSVDTTLPFQYNDSMFVLPPSTISVAEVDKAAADEGNSLPAPVRLKNECKLFATPVRIQGKYMKPMPCARTPDPRAVAAMAETFKHSPLETDEVF